MKIHKDKLVIFGSRSIIIPLVLLTLAFLMGSCDQKPVETIAQGNETPLATLTPLHPSPSVTPTPNPTITPTLQLIDSDLVYAVVGLFPEQALPIYLEPSLTAGISGEIPSTGISIRTTGIEINADNITWLQIEYQGSAGWLDQSYLARQFGDVDEEVISLAQTVAAALKEADYDRLRTKVHPDSCLRFSPYPSLRSIDLTFCPDRLADLPGSSTLYTWGNYDGSGEPIMLTFDEYHQRFVYDQDFFQPEVVGFNQEVSSGNAINNIPEIYPDGMIVEYHFPGFDPQYGGMDWRSLRMVFIKEYGVWYLVALIHGEWTI
jgi:hypothetical protein